MPIQKLLISPWKQTRFPHDFGTNGDRNFPQQMRTPPWQMERDIRLTYTGNEDLCWRILNFIRGRWNGI